MRNMHSAACCEQQEPPQITAAKEQDTCQPHAHRQKCCPALLARRARGARRPLSAHTPPLILNSHTSRERAESAPA